MTRTLKIRLAVTATAAAVLAAVAAIVLGGEPYTVRAQFANAGGLVEGGLVQVAGRKVGTIAHIGVSADGRADVHLEIDDDAVTPLRDGARATIRALGQAGITNRFVDLTLGPASGRELEDGAVLPQERTTSVVALDAILDSFGPRQREDLRRLIAGSAEIFAGSGAQRMNAMLADLDPALAEIDALAGELSRDRAAISRVIRSGARTASALASRREDLRSAVGHTATALGAVARERGALGGLLDRAPSVLRQASGTLRTADRTVVALRPALRELPAAARPLDGLLARSRDVLPQVTPVVRTLNAQLPGLRRSLAGLAPLQRPAVRALDSAARALEDARPIVRGARFYGSDFVLGILNGLVGAGSYNYTRNGHYERLDFIQPPQSSISGFGSKLLQGFDPLPGVIGLRTGLTRRCPGGNVPPAIDGSSPWMPDPLLCDPAHNTPASVNDP